MRAKNSVEGRNDQRGDIPTDLAIEALFSRWNRTDAPGFAAGVRLNGTTIFRRAGGMASLESGAALSCQTGLRIGSVTKHFTALLALKLHQHKILNLDLPLREYLPDLSEFAGCPSIAELLQHRGVARCHIELGFLAHGMAVPGKGSAFRALARQTGTHPSPRSAFLYNNGGYHLVSLAIERVAGKALDDLFKEHLFQPLGMHRTCLWPSDYDVGAELASMHLEDGGKWRRGLFPSVELLGEGGIVSSLDDMLRWTDHLMVQVKSGETPWPAETQGTDELDDFDFGYRAGMFVQSYRGLTIIWHAGAVIGGLSQMMLVPELGLEIVILTNGAPDCNPVSLSWSIVDLFLGPPSRPCAQPGADVAKAIVGNWWCPDAAILYSVVGDGTGLCLRICGSSSAIPLHCNADGTFTARSTSVGLIKLTLERSSDRNALIVQVDKVRHRCGRLEQARSANVADRWPRGRFVCRDCDIGAEIEAKSDGLLLRLSDRNGAQAYALTALSETTAIGAPVGCIFAPDVVMALECEGGQALGFELNSLRLRNLRFEPV